MLQLRVAGSDQTYPLTKKTVVGSESSADVVLDGETIKPTHCILTAAGSRVMLMVLDPAAVVEVNGEKALQKALKAGDSLKIGDVELTLEEAAEAPAVDAGTDQSGPPQLGNATLPPTDRPPEGMPDPGIAAAPVALVLKHGPDIGREFPISGDSVSIGRDPAREVTLDDPRISASHATLTRKDGVWTFSDDGSSGGSRVNGIKVSSIAVSDGDELEMGDSVLVLRVKSTPPPIETAPPSDQVAEPAVEAVGKIEESGTGSSDAPPIGGDDPTSAAPPIGGDDAAAKAPAIGDDDAVSKAPLIDAAADDSAATPLPAGEIAAGLDAAHGLHLEVTKGPEPGRRIDLRDGLLKVGRAPDSDIVIGEKSVSGKHGEFRVEGNSVTFTDTNSSAGSKVNGIKIDSLALEPGDELALGAEVVLVLRAASAAAVAAPDVAADDSAGTPAPMDPAEAAALMGGPSPSPAPSASSDGPRIAIVKGPGKNTEVVLSKVVTTVGRAPDNDIVLNEQSVSGKHGEFRWADGTLQFSDKGSSAGSKVNGIKVDALPLEEGDEVQLGTVSLLRVASMGRAAIVADAPVSAPDPGATPAPDSPVVPAATPAAVPSAAPAPTDELPKRSSAGSYTLVGTSAGIDGKIFSLGGEIVVGTDATAKIVLPSESGAAAKHAEVFDGPTGPAIRRLPGASEVLVQGVPVELLPLAHGDVIGLGQAQLIVRGSGKGVAKGGGAAPKSAGTDVLSTRYRIVVKSGAHAGSEFKVVGLTRVGRDPRCDVVLTDPTVSGSHCEIAPISGGWVVRDVGSSAGTFLGDLKVVTDMAVKHGTMIKCGEVDVLFEDTEAAIELAAATPVPAATPAKPAPVKLTGVRRRPRGAEPSPGEKALLVVSGTNRGVRWEFADKVTLGRLESNDIALENPEVSGEHARLRLHDGGILLEDRGSTNGTRVNDEPVHTKLLQHGDVIEIQDFEFMFLEPGKAVPELDRYSRPSLIKIGDANKRLGRWRIPLTLTIGRATVHNVVIPDDSEVSGDHAKIVDRSGQFHLVDTSTNGTRVNGKKVKGEIRLHHGDMIAIGASKFAFKDAHKSLEVQELRGSQIGAMLGLVVVLVIGLVIAGYITFYGDTGGKRERPNLLTVNHDFSAPASAGNVPGWKIQHTGEIGVAVSSTGDSGFLEVKAGGGTVGPTSQFEAIYDGPVSYQRLNAYQLRGRVKAQGAESGGAALRLRFHRADGTMFDRYTQWVADTNDAFLKLSVTVRPPQNARSVEVAAVTRGRAGLVRFDDLKLHAIPLSDKAADKLPNSGKITVKDRFGSLSASVDTQGVVSLARGSDVVFAKLFFQLRGMPGLGGRALPRVDQLLSYTESMDQESDAIILSMVGFDFATGQSLQYDVVVRPTKGAAGDDEGGIEIVADFRALTSNTSAGKAEAVVLCQGAGGREGKWANRRRNSEGRFSTSPNDFPAEIGVTHWVVGSQATELCLKFEQEAVVLGQYVEATKSVDGVAQLSSDYTAGRLELLVTTAGPDSAENYLLATQKIKNATESETGDKGREYDAHQAFVQEFGWLTAEASASKNRVAEILRELDENLRPIREDTDELIESLENSAENGITVDAEQKAKYDEQLDLFAKVRETYGVTPGASEVDELETRLRSAMDKADVGVKKKIVQAIFEEAQAAVAAGNMLKARILLEGLTEHQPDLLGGLAIKVEVFKLLTKLDEGRDDAGARDAAFAKAKREAAIKAAGEDPAGAVKAWQAFLRAYPDPIGGNPELSKQAKEALEQIRLLTRPNR